MVGRRNTDMAGPAPSEKRNLNTAVQDGKALVTVLGMEAESVLGKRTARVVGFLALIAVTVAALLLFLDWYIDPGKPDQRKDLILTAAQILGGAALLSGVYFTWRTLQVNREGQITERFTRAIDQLGKTDDSGNPRLEIRLGGIYSLERIARDSPARDYSTVMDVLTAYVRENAPWPPKTSKPAKETSTLDTIPGKAPAEQDGGRERDGERTPWDLPTDIQAIFDVITRREEGHIPKEQLAQLDFRDTDLRYFSPAEGVHLEGATFSGAHLEKASLMGTHLQGARLIGTHLEGAEFSGVHLEGAWLLDTHLEGAWISGAHFEGGRLVKVYLTGAIGLGQTTGLTEEHLEWVIGDETITLPQGLVRPAAWSKSIEEQVEIIEERLQRMHKDE
jgi:hypothetical protein